MKLKILFQAFLEGEDRVRCFICVRFLKPVEWNRPWKRFFLFWMAPQFTVGIVRELEEKASNGQNLVSLLEITTCFKCANWVNQHPLEGEMLATARLKSIGDGK